ncbi:MAG: putative porin [Candidatus Binatia bacterium]
MKKRWFALGLVLAAAATTSARDLEDILKEKGVITDTEAMEGKAAKEQSSAPALPPLPDWVTKAKFSGDVRIRNESFFRKGDPDRVRQRFRLRFGAKVTPTNESEIGLRIASGTPGDPISNNQSFDDAFTFKNIDITNAYLKIAPAATLGWARPYLTLMGGKFDTPTWHPTKLHFDSDLTPEGFFETINAVQASSGMLRTLQLNLGQWILEELSSDGDSALFTFQGLTNLALSESVALTLAVGNFLYQKPSTVAAERNGNGELTITNTVLLSDGTVVGGRTVDPAEEGPNGDGLDANGEPIEIVAFANDFNIFDAGADLNVRTGSPRWPLRVFGQYVMNTEASSDDTGYQAGAGIGPIKDPGDVNFTYAYQRLETDAVVSAFSDSDFGRDGGTNTEGHILQLNYMLPMKGLQFTSTAWIVEPVRSVSGRSSETEYRWQVDLIGKF